MKTKSIILTMIFACAATMLMAQGTWTQKADFGGTARHTAVGFVIGDKAYVGTGNDGIDRKDFWEYDPVADVWSQIADFGGVPREAAEAFSIGSKGYVGTGWGQNGSAFYGDFWEYNPATNEWSQKADVGGLPRRGGVGFSIGNKGYIGIGHNVNGYVLDFWEYDPVADTWTRKSDFPGSGRENLVGFSIGSRGYVEEHVLAANHVFEVCPDFRNSFVDEAVCTANIKCESLLEELCDDEWTEELERHVLWKTALIELEVRTNNNDGTS